MRTTDLRTTGDRRPIDPDAVALVALRLFDDRGFEAVSLDEVAEAAGVSRRSLFRLFPSKAALVWGGLDAFATRFTRTLRARPAEEPAAAAVRAAYRVAACFPEDELEVTRRRVRVIRANPSLSRGGESAAAALTEVVVQFVTDREAGGVPSLETAVRARTLVAAASTALSWWAATDEGRPEHVVDRALALLV